MLPKIVWMLWLQGWENTPPLVRACRASWLQHNPTWDFHFLTEQTLREFAEGELLERLMTGGGPRETISDIARLELLLRHGGVWADATTYCLRRLDDWIELAASSGFFAFNRPGPDRMISNWMLAATPGNYIVQNWLTRCTAYWSGRKERDHYYWQHRLFAEAYENDVRFKKEWDATPKLSADGPHCFVPSRETLFRPVDTFHRLIVETAQTPVLKLTHKLDHSLGKPGTGYHWLCERVIDGKAKWLEDHSQKRAEVEMVKPLSESEVNSAKFDQPPCPIKTKLIICSTPRSGSYLLCHAMIHHRIGVPHEYFNGLNASTIGPRIGAGNIATPQLEVDGPARGATSLHSWCTEPSMACLLPKYRADNLPNTSNGR
jgi:hypothetical protein